MPAGPAWTPGRLPAGFAGFTALPEGEVEGVLLAGLLCSGHPARGVVLLLSQVAAGKLAVAGMLHHGEIDITIGAVGGPLGFQLGDQAANGVQALGGPRHTVGRQDI